MYRYARLLVHLDLTESDGDVIRYAARITKLAQSERVEFRLTIPGKDDPSAMLVASSVGVARELARKSIRKYYRGHPRTSVEVSVSEGVDIYEILNAALKQKPDLIIVAKTSAQPHLAEKLARKAPCSVMAITPGGNPAFKKLLVPVDFSKYATNALKVAVAFASAMKLKRIYCHHSFAIPGGYHKTGMTREQWIDDHMKWAEQEFQRFVSGIDARGLKTELLLDVAPTLAGAVVARQKKDGFDLVIMGCRGKDALSALLLGSNTADLLAETRVPLVMVKEKGTGKSFLQHLLGD
jgi:nucleotide-binding universal stress UspA family protein